MQRQAIDSKKIAAKHIFYKELVLRIYKELPKLNSKKLVNNPFRKWMKT